MPYRQNYRQISLLQKCIQLFPQILIFAFSTKYIGDLGLYNYIIRILRTSFFLNQSVKKTESAMQNINISSYAPVYSQNAQVLASLF